MQPQDAGCGGRPNRTNCHHYISTATSLNSILTSPWFPQLSLSLSKTNISYLLHALKSHGLMPSPQLTLSRKPSFICLRKMETNGQKISQLPPTMTANLPTYVSVTCFIGRCSSFHKPNLPPMLKAPSVSRDLTLLAFSTLLYLLQTFLLYWIFFISCQTCSTPNSSLTFKSQSQ